MSILEFDDGIGGRLRGTLHAPGATPGDVLTVGATRGAISPSPGGGSQTVKAVRKSIAFDTASLLPAAFPITAVDALGTFTIAGDHVAAFTAPNTFKVFGSTGNDGPYEVASATLDGGDTVIDVGRSIDATADGTIGNTGRAGIVVTAVAALDFLPGLTTGRLISYLRLPTTWDGTSPTLHVTSTEGRAAGIDYAVLALDTNGDSDYGDGVYFVTDGANELPIPHGYFATATDLVAYVDDGNGADPGASMGEAEIILNILAAS